MPKKPKKTKKVSAAAKPKAGSRALAKLAPGHNIDDLKASLKDILGAVPSDVTMTFNKKLSPGGIRAGDGSWDGNIYKYRC